MIQHGIVYSISTAAAIMSALQQHDSRSCADSEASGAARMPAAAYCCLIVVRCAYSVPVLTAAAYRPLYALHSATRAVCEIMQNIVEQKLSP
jgi:hypothetical protein